MLMDRLVNTEKEVVSRETRKAVNALEKGIEMARLRKELSDKTREVDELMDMLDRAYKQNDSANAKVLELTDKVNRLFIELGVNEDEE